MRGLPFVLFSAPLEVFFREVAGPFVAGVAVSAGLAGWLLRGRKR